MDLSEFVESAEINCEVNGGKGDFFDLLDFPDEIIEEIFSYLNIKDRMRARMNKRLSKIEAESKYYVNDVQLQQIFGYFQKCVIIDSQHYPFAFINRVAHNASIRKLVVRFRASDSRTSKFLDLIKKFRDVGELELLFWEMTTEQVNEIMNDSLFLDLTRKCKTLSLKSNLDRVLFDNISVEALHKVCQSMSDGSTSFRKLIIGMSKEKLNAFLNFLGIAYRNEQIFSNKSIEAYKYTLSSEISFVNIFDGFFRILISDSTLSEQYVVFHIELHKNLESLNTAKKPRSTNLKRVRMDVYSE